MKVIDHPKPIPGTERSASRLTFKTRRADPAHRLPFVGYAPGTVVWSFWAVPATGGYVGGNETGKALAQLFMKHLREHGGGGPGALQHIALSMLGRPDDDSPEAESRRGQAVGFFYELERWLAGSAKYLGDGLDRLDSKAALKAANEGLSRDGIAHLITTKEQ